MLTGNKEFILLHTFLQSYTLNAGLSREVPCDLPGLILRLRKKTLFEGVTLQVNLLFYKLPVILACLSSKNQIKYLSMEIVIISVFVVGYLAIALEHPIRINKTATAILTAAVCWTIFALTSHDIHHVEEGLSEHLKEAAEILFFLMGAMTIVEFIDVHEGFRLITDRIRTKDATRLLWIISLVTFFLSPILDNLTTSIVMMSLTQKLISDRERRLFFGGMIVIAANAGGAWSPMGDVTTTMLWIKGFISAHGVVTSLFLPSLICLLVPLAVTSLMMPKAEVVRPAHNKNGNGEYENLAGSRVMLITGILALISVPVFKIITHLPPYMGMMLGLSIVWIVSEVINSDKDEEERKEFSAAKALSRIDTSSILFFFGILLAIGSLQEIGALRAMAEWLDRTLNNPVLINLIIGVLSAIIDNVPLVAGAMGMYDLAPEGIFATDGLFWEFLAYTAGTGGSLLIIGSAAGVAVMGMEKIDFIWYLKRMTFLALVGYLAGAGVYLLLEQFDTLAAMF